MLALADALEIVVHEVDVETCLEHAREDLSPAIEVIKVVSVYPIENVEESVKTECGNVVRGDVFNEANLVEHHDLRDKCDSLEPQTEAPHELPCGPSRVNYHCEHQGRRQEHFQMREVVTQRIVSLYRMKTRQQIINVTRYYYKIFF